MKLFAKALNIKGFLQEGSRTPIKKFCLLSPILIFRINKKGAVHFVAGVILLISVIRFLVYNKNKNILTGILYFEKIIVFYIYALFIEQYLALA